jgi:Domain of unknown function (DUF4266)
MKQMNASTGRRWLVLGGVLAALGAGGCATVQPWQRGRLADPEMVFDGDAAGRDYTAHWQEAREASAGGSGVQSGGCGCK